MKINRTAAIVAAALTAVVGATAGGIAFAKHQAHVKQCDAFADRAIAEYFEAQDIMARTKATQERLNAIDSEDGLFALMQLGQVVEDGERNRAQWDAFEARSERTRAEFQATCGAARVNQMKADLSRMVQPQK